MQINDKALEAALEAFMEANAGKDGYVPIQDMREAIEAYKRAEWRPISEAPKDGTSILVINDAQGAPETGGTYPFEIGVAQWNSGPYYNQEECKWRSSYCADLKMYFTPTHWQPLPQPPEL